MTDRQFRVGGLRDGLIMACSVDLDILVGDDSIRAVTESAPGPVWRYLRAEVGVKLGIEHAGIDDQPATRSIVAACYLIRNKSSMANPVKWNARPDLIDWDADFRHPPGHMVIHRLKVTTGQNP